MKKTTRRIILLTACCIPALPPAAAKADRQTIVSGGLAVRQGYDSNVYRTNTNKVDEWSTALSPTLSLTSSSPRDTLNFSYSPSYVYNHRTDEGHFDHSLLLAANRALSDRWQLSVNDSFEKSDDSTLGRDETRDTSNRVNLSENLPRNRYWTNYFGINNTWQYRQNSTLSLGYNHSIYENDVNPDYQRHGVPLSVSHEINRQWQAEAGYTFTEGIFDRYDSRQHTTNAKLIYRLTPHKAIYGFGNFSTTDYSDDRPGYDTVGGRLGYSQQIDQQSDIDLGAGLSSTGRDGDSSTSAFDYSLAYRRQFERGTFSLDGAGGFDDRQFNGENDGLSKFWSIKPVLRYQLAEKLASSLYALYRDDKYIERTPEQTEKSYEAGGSLDWSFSRWYTAGIRYVYHKLDSNIAGNDYDDHRLYLTLSAAKELWKW